MYDEIEAQYYVHNNDSSVRASSVNGGGSRPVSQPSGKKEEYSSRSALRNKGRKRLVELLATHNKKFNQITSYTDFLNSWLAGMFPIKNITRTEMYIDGSGRRGWSVTRRIVFSTAEGPVEHTVADHSFSMKCALEVTSRKLVSNYYFGSTQSDEVPSKESIQGDATQQSEKANNTIITRDQQETVENPTGSLQVQQMRVASSEPLHQFPTLVTRWMPITVLKIKTTDKMGDVIASYYLPETFLDTVAKCAPNTVPFETFVYGQYDVAMKFVVNANKFHCGKVIVSIKFDSYQADDINQGYQAALSRPHIVLDLSANNEGTIDIPFRYHRVFVRNQTHATATTGIRPGKYASVYVQILSPLKTGPQGSNDIDIRPYYMYKRADFAGMSYKIALTQMDTISGLASALPTRALKEILMGVEKSLDQLGRSHNQDKPTQNEATIVIPRPRMCFPHGKGVSDATPMQMNPTALTSFNAIKAFPDDPKTTLDIAKIWGVRNTFTWKAGDTEGNVLFNSVIDPTSRFYDQDYTGEPTPLEYIASIYNFWSGPIELRFDFISNSFHTGAVIISAEFNRTSKDTDECESHSTYTKTFHLGDQKSVRMVVPYIYDTVMRRNTTLPYCPIIDKDVTTTDDIKATAMGLRAEAKMRVKVRVINALRPVASAPQEIEVLVYMRAGKNFVLHGLRQSNFWDARDIVPIDSFPSDKYLPVKPVAAIARGKRDTKDPKEQRIQDHRYLPASVANKWNEIKPYPHTQMDNGEKEDEDPTENFSQGVSSFGIQSIDTQVGIKDILRRPVLLFDSIEVKGDQTGFFIPLMPPSRMMQYDREKKQSTSFQSLLGCTPHAVIMNLFRFWRGSIRLTIMMHTGGAAPVYLTFVPHSGIRKFGPMKVNGVTKSNKTPIYGSGLTTDVLIPVVNPTTVVQCPFDTENNWCLTFEEDALRNYSWRDKGDTTSGHLVISATQDVTLSVWWAAGDDFEVANFYGIPKVTTNQWKYMYSDEHARVQSDDVVEDEGLVTYRYPPPSQGFPLRNISTGVEMLWKGVKSVATPERVLNTAVCMVPGIGGAYATATALDAVGTCVNKVADTTRQVGDTVVDKLDILSAKLGTSMDYITQVVQDTVSKAVGTLTNGALYASYCFDVILDILVAWVDRSWTAIGVGVIRFVTKVLGVKMVTTLMEQAVSLGQAISELMKPHRAVVQAPPERSATIVGILAGIIGTIMGVKLSPNFGRGFYDNLIVRLTESRGISYLMVMLKFVEATFTTIKDMIMHALGYVSPEHMALKMLSGSSVILDKFITEAQLVTTEANSALVQDPGFRYRIWNTVMQAYQIQKLLITVPTANASPVLSRLCSDVIKMSNEKFVDISASPVRYEPFVICIEGPAGIGKSELVESLVSKMLNGIKLKRPHSGSIYFRMPGSKFWSGYRDQPVVAYDDWANLTDPTLLAQQISELYQLKSTSTFIPEMAHLEEKKIRGNPLIVVLLCNEAFPQNALSSLAHTPEAIYRRRDILLHANRKHNYVGINLRDMSQEDQIGFKHLEFSKYANPADRATLGAKKLEYDVTSDFIVQKFQRWHAQEQLKVKRRLDNIRVGMTEAPLEALKLEDPFELYYSVSTRLAETTDTPTNGFLPSEILAAEVRRIALTLEQYQRVEAEIIVPDEPVNPFVAGTQGPTLNQAIGVITLGIATSRVCLASILNMSGEACYQALQWLVSKHLPVKQCCVCMEDKNVEWYCIQAEEAMGEQANTHYVCSACMVSSASAGNPIVACPLCRSQRFQKWSIEEHNVALSLLAWTAYKCALTAEQIVDYGKKLFLRKNDVDGLPFLMAMVFRFGASLGTVLAGALPGRMAWFGASIGTAIDKTEGDLQQMGIRLPGYQIDDPFEDSEIEELPDNTPSVIEALQCSVRLGKLQEKLTQRVRHETPCLHGLLRGLEHAIRYSEGKYIVPHGGTMLYIPEKLCEDQCYFQDELLLGNFYQALLDNHRHVYNAAVVGYINAPENKEFHRNRIPEVLRPEWMSPNIALQQEVQQVTQDDWWMHVGGFWEKYKYIILTVGGVITAVGTLISLNKLFQDAPQAVAQYIGSGDEVTRNLRNTTRTLQRVRTSRPHFQECSEQVELDSVVKKYIARNYVTISLCKDAGKVMMTACGVYGHKAILPRHYVKALKNAAKDGVKIEAGPALFPHEWKEYTFDEVDFVISDTTDIAVWTLPASFGMFKDIRKFITTDDDLTRPITTDGCIFLAPTRLNPLLKEQSLEILGLQNSQAVEDKDGEFFEAHDVLCYNYSQPGACGSLVMLTRTQRPIVAMHFAGLGPRGTSGEGFGVILTKETLGDVLSGDKAVTQLEDWEGPSLDEAKIILEDTNVHYIGAVTKQQTPFAPKKSKIRPSLIQGVNGLEPFTEPCILDKTDSRYVHEDTPLVAGCKKHGKLTRDFPTSTIQRASEGLWDGWLSKMKPVINTPHKLTPQQASSGFPNVEYYDPIVLNTSAGFPYVCTPKKAKSDHIKYITNEINQPIGAEISEEVLKEMNRKEKLRKEGIQPITPFIDTLKDERKKPEKVRKYGGTRVFCNPPIDYVIAMRQNFLHFTAAFMKHRMTQQHAIGINLTGTEWTALTNKLIDKGFNNINTIDYANFGPGFNAHVANAASDLMVKWVMLNVEDVDEVELKVLLHECINSVHLCHNTLYQQKSGSPSGAPITAVINTLVNFLYIFIAWLQIVGPKLNDKGKFVWEEFIKSVVIFCYGDDLIMAVTDEYKDLFNSLTISKFFATYGIVATDASKSTEVECNIPITKASFLKHGFKKHERHIHLWQSVLDWVSVNDATQWVWECADLKLATRENCEAALLQAHGHGKVKFENFKTQVNGALIKKGIQPLTLNWEEVDDKFYPPLVY